MRTSSERRARVGEHLATLRLDEPNAAKPSLQDARAAASALIERRGFPTRKDEDWRYLDLAPISAVSFSPARASEYERSEAGVIDASSTSLGGPRLVFVNGHFAPEFTRLSELREGIIVSTLAAELANGNDRTTALSSLSEHDHAFTALNTVLFEDGAYVSVAAGTTLRAPIELLFFSDAHTPLLASPRSVISAGKDSSFTVVETYAGLAGEPSLTNALTEFVLEEGAVVEHYKVQDEPETAFHLALVRVHQQQSSTFSSHAFSLGGAIARHEVRIELGGEHAEVRLDGLYMPYGHQQHDNPVFVDHIAPSCTSRQVYKGILDDFGHGVFNGHIVVRQGAHQTDASQTNKNLLLSDHAEVDTRPRLEILDDDVRCTHGAAVGRLDDDALFYLQSRGIPEREARGVLTNAFARELVDRVGPWALRLHIEQLIAARLSGARVEPSHPTRS